MACLDLIPGPILMIISLQRNSKVYELQAELGIRIFKGKVKDFVN